VVFSSSHYLYQVLGLSGGPVQFNRYGDSLGAVRSGDRISVVAIFSAPVQTVPGVHPASYTVGNFPGGKVAGAWS